MRQSDYLPFLDELEARASEAVLRTYALMDYPEETVVERMWAQKGVEGMRLAIAEAFLEERIVFSEESS